MKVAIVHDWLTGMRGGEKCLEVACRMFPDARLFTLLHARGSTSPDVERMAITTSFLQRLPGVRHYYRSLLPLMPAAVARWRVPNDVDLVLSFSHAVAKAIRVPPGIPHVCYCFTPMRYAWHRREDYVGKGRSPIRWLQNRVLDWFQRWDRGAASRVTHFVAISQTIAHRIADCYGRSSTVIYPPADVAFYTPADVPREDYYLCVSALVPYKRIDLAIEACNRLGRRLVVVGEGPERKRLQALAGSNVTLAGWLSNEEIREHYRRARALIFPANEDFGIVPVEAQACGAWVLAYGQGGATETVVESKTGLFFDEQTVDAVCRTMIDFESMGGAADPEAPRTNAEQFSLARFERELAAFLAEAKVETTKASRRQE